MSTQNANLTTLVILAIAALIIIWLFVSLNSSLSPCIGPRPDPVGGITSTTEPDGIVNISWDRPVNAHSFKVYLNNCPIPVTAGNHKVGACGGPESCPEDASVCTACVSQTKYKKIIDTEDTEIVLRTCEPCLCYIVVPYNSCGQAGPCNEIHYVNVQCSVSTVDAWVGINESNVSYIYWSSPRCADAIIILVDGVELERVAASNNAYEITAIASNSEISVQAVSECGVGPITIVRALVSSEFKSQAPKTVDDAARMAKMAEWKRAQSQVSAAKKNHRRQAHPRGRQPTNHTTIKKYDISASVDVYQL